MNNILKETRRSSYIQRPFTRQAEILDVMGDREMSARQICAALGAEDMNYVRPRLTELCKRGEIEVTKKAYDLATNRHVAMYRIRREEDNPNV